MSLEFCVTHLLAVNLLAVLICLYDKNHARKNKWRIPEKTLFLVSIFGGALFMFITMKLIRHKTRHKRFMIGLPLIIILQIILIFYIINLTTDFNPFII